MGYARYSEDNGPLQRLYDRACVITYGVIGIAAGIFGVIGVNAGYVLNSRIVFVLIFVTDSSRFCEQGLLLLRTCERYLVLLSVIYSFIIGCFNILCRQHFLYVVLCFYILLDL